MSMPRMSAKSPASAFPSRWVIHCLQSVPCVFVRGRGRVRQANRRSPRRTVSVRTRRCAVSPRREKRNRRPTPGSVARVAAAIPQEISACARSRRWSSLSVESSPAKNTSSGARTEYSSRNSASSGACSRAAAIANSGTTPDPPAMSWTGERSGSVGVQTKYRPRGPCTSSSSPSASWCTRYGETSPAGTSSTARTTRVVSPDDATE